MRIKKAAAVFMCLVTALSFFGCSYVNNVVDNYKRTPRVIEKPEAEQIFEYLKDEDIDSLCELFSPEVSKTHDIKSEWKYFFSHLDGDLVSYKKISYPNEGLGVDKDGEVYDSHVSVNYKNAKTDTGKVYSEFGYYRVQVSRDNPDSVGITTFTMLDPDTGKWITVGER